MVSTCPISTKRVDANLIRLNALFVTILVLSFLFSGQNIFLILLFMDFFFRFLKKQKLSFITMLSLTILKKLNISQKLCDEAPKRFALQLGVGITFLMLLSSFVGQDILVYGLSTILLVCASLEAIFEYCIGCHVYKYIQPFLKVDR